MRWLILFCLSFLSGNIGASELHISQQYLHINKSGKVGHLSHLAIKTQSSDDLSFGVSANYLDRFNLYETSIGPQVIYKLNEKIALELKYLKAKSGSEILATDQYFLSVYMAHSPGYSSALSYQNSNYSLTHLQWIRWGLEIEKFKHLILIPYALFGQAHFHRPYNSREVNSFGAKVISQHLDQYRFIAFASKGIEATQGLIGRSSQTIETKTIGGGVGRNFSQNIKIDALFDYTDLGKLRNQFLTTTLNLNWIF